MGENDGGITDNGKLVYAGHADFAAGRARV